MFHEQLMSCLENSRNVNGLMLLEGEWGVGKTYYIKNEFLPGYDRTAYYFSVYGLDSVFSFKEKLAAKIIEEKGKYASTVLKGGETIFKTLSKMKVGGISAQDLFGATNGMIVDSIISKAAGNLVIIDDLERIPSTDLKENILAECLSLNEELNISFIVVSNFIESKVSPEKVEKFFSFRCFLRNTTEEIYKLSFGSEIIEACDDFKPFIIREIEKRGTGNLRELSRLAICLDKIMKMLSERHIANNVHEMIITWGFDILSAVQSGHDINEIKRSKEESVENNDGVFKTVHYKPSDEFINYIFGYAVEFSDISELGNFPRFQDEVDSLIFNEYSNWTEEEFMKSVEVTVDYINKESVEIKKWLEAIYTLEMLIESEYILSEDVGDFNFVSENIRVLGESKEFQLDSRPGYSLSLSESKYEAIYIDLLNIHTDKSIEKLSKKLEGNIVEKGFFACVSDEDMKMSREQIFKVLTKIDKNIWPDVHKSWSAKEIVFFSKWFKNEFVNVDFLTNTAVGDFDSLRALIEIIFNSNSSDLSQYKNAVLKNRVSVMNNEIKPIEVRNKQREKRRL